MIYQFKNFKLDVVIGYGAGPNPREALDSILQKRGIVKPKREVLLNRAFRPDSKIIFHKMDQGVNNVWK